MIKTVDDINLNDWFIERELKFVPDHFIKTNINLTPESLFWIREKLSGRYVLVPNGDTLLYHYTQHPAFEDPSEATMFILMFG